MLATILKVTEEKTIAFAVCLFVMLMIQQHDMHDAVRLFLLLSVGFVFSEVINIKFLITLVVTAVSIKFLFV